MGTRKKIVRCFYAAAALCGIVESVPAANMSNYPAWWITRGVVNTNAATTNDFAAATAGQVKWMATNAFVELNSKLAPWGGAGTSVAAVVSSFTATNNYRAVNVGQLKCLAQPFYERLIVVGFTNDTPWSGTTTDDLNYAVVNIGQLKQVFAFDVPANGDADGDGLGSWVETGTGLYVSPNNTGSSATTNDTDGDGLLDGAEVSARTNPNSNDTNRPLVTISFPLNLQNVSWTP